jgi:hypothetical protein
MAGVRSFVDGSASAGAIFQVGIAMGKLHGAILDHREHRN